MDTHAVVVAILAATLLTWLPGTAILLLARKSIFTSIAAAPAVTLGVVYLGTMAAGALGLRWSAWTLALTTALVGAIVWFVLRTWPAAATPGPSERRWSSRGVVFVVVAGAAAVLIGALVYIKVSDWFNIVPQDFDAVFQANAIRYIAETGDGTPEGLRAINSYGSDPGRAYYYPSAFHALVALTSVVGKVGVVGALHAQVITWFLAIVLGLALLAKTFRIGAFGTGVALLVSTSFTSFPYELLWRGLFPFAQSLVLVVPITVLLAQGARRRGVGDALVVALAAAGMVGVHTSGVTSTVVLAGPLLVALLVRQRAQLKQTVLWMVLAAGISAVLLIPVALGLMGISGDLAYDWPALKSVRDGVKSALLFGTGYRDTYQLALAALVLPGALLAFRRRYSPTYALALSMFAAMGLYVFAVAIDSPLSLVLTGTWWNDQLRLAALAAVLAPLFVGVLFDTIGEVAIRLVRRSPRLTTEMNRINPTLYSHGATAMAALLTIAVFAVAMGAAYFDRSYWAVHYRYTYGPMVSPLKAEAMKQLEFLTGPGERVMNDNIDGSAWMFALDGVLPVAGHYSRDTSSELQMLLLDHFDELPERADVQAAVDELDIRYVITMNGFIEGQEVRSTGLDELDLFPDVFNLIYDNGEARIYEIAPEFAGAP